MLAIGLGLAAAPTGARAADPLPPLVTTLETVTDAAGDVLTAAPIDPAKNENPAPPVLGDNPRADITQASLEYAPGWIRMKVQVKNPIDPVKDPAWSDRSDAEWVLDTNADGKPEFSVEFATDQGELYGAVFDMNKPDNKSLCEADSASFSPQDGYVLVIDPKCIGNPKSLGYSVAMFIDTNPKDENAPMASDRVPDQGFQEVAAPGQPVDASPAPRGAAGTPTAPAAISPAPAPGAPAPATGPTSTAPARAAAGTQASPSSSVTGADALESGAAPGSPLARTGSPTQTRALFGLGLMLFGIGLVVMTRPGARRQFA